MGGVEGEKAGKEKVVQLKKELIRKGELGESGLVWRNQERRPKGVQRIKKEEPSSPNLKIETPPSPNLLYPPTPPHRYELMPLSRYQSLDPNDFKWSLMCQGRSCDRKKVCDATGSAA